MSAFYCTLGFILNSIIQYFILTDLVMHLNRVIRKEISQDAIKMAWFTKLLYGNCSIECLPLKNTHTHTCERHTNSYKYIWIHISEVESLTAGQHSDDVLIKYLNKHFVTHNFIQILFPITLALLIHTCQTTLLCNNCYPYFIAYETEDQINYLYVIALSN